MKIRTRVAAIVLGTMVAAVAITAVVASRVLLNGFESLEASDAGEDLQRATAAVEAELDSLAFKSVDWAMWDETYAFLAAPADDHPWVASNAVDETFETLQVDVFLVSDLRGEVVVERAYAHGEVHGARVPDALLAALRPAGVLHSVGQQRPNRSGLLRADGSALLFAAHEVTDSTGSATARGVLVMARWLDDALVTDWGTRIGLDLDVAVVPEGAQAPDEETIDIDGGNVIAVTGYPDVSGDALLAISVRQPRDIVETGRFSLAILLLLMIATLGAATLVLTPALDRSLLRRLRQLTGQTTQVGAAGKVDQRVAVEGDDEVSELARSINSMLASIERANQEQELRNVELVEALEGKDRFVSTVAHELRTPITAVKGLALTLLRAEDRLDQAKQRELLTRLAERTDGMQELVEELLTMSRLAAGKISASPVPVDLAVHIDDLLDDLATVMADVRADITSDAIAVVDPDHLSRILINLLENARRYGAPPIEIKGALDGPEVSIAVVDHGKGVSRGDAERLFESFEQMETRSQEGLGLGLSIVRSLTELNGGEVTCVETPAGGATFIVRLPAGSMEDVVLHHHIRSTTAGS